MNFYFEAAKTLDRLDAKQGSIKGVLATLPEKDRKRTAALVIETLKYKVVLNEVIKASKLMTEERKLSSRNLALILCHDILLSKGGIQAGDGPLKQAILRHKTRLNSEFIRIKIRRGAKSNEELAQVGDARAAQIPRYVRINTTMWTTEDAIKHYESKGFILSGPFESSKGFAIDQHIPNLLNFSPQTQFQNDMPYKTGKVILQDKASCFPALVLAPPALESSVVIDATAAPGNKTSHLSALMQNKGKLFAFERDHKRFSTLKMMLSKANCRNVEPVNIDFLTVQPNDKTYSAVTHILLDPSCSGSGIVNRLDHLLENEEEDDTDQTERLTKLSNFQLTMIRHAMKFPRVIKIVYSTCSIHAMENEHVVREALQCAEAQAGGFVLAPQGDVLPAWPRRGLTEEMHKAEDALSVIRCSPDHDATNGFFVSCFVRAAGSQQGINVTQVKRKMPDLEGDDSTEVSQTKRAKKAKKKRKGTH
ncbi:S-adenosyl-L-methionine-dependent methyltransferase [Athelia psychrophila]|uniref:S-adenosyl-L-methionine-dependent methyltransferase n=1 Tax=Athelia psychrophila TaxID=1759441 RepID=A0A166UN45_9AGAM|nr:S-adenosyl-L-methionine-dependent methyltransferase [Fibularhizoctonia sp. CBS 109695]